MHALADVRAVGSDDAERDPLAILVDAPVVGPGRRAPGRPKNWACPRSASASLPACKPAASIKLATNTPMHMHIEHAMDVNCGTVLDGALADRRANPHHPADCRHPCCFDRHNDRLAAAWRQQTLPLSTGGNQ